MQWVRARGATAAQMSARLPELTGSSPLKKRPPSWQARTASPCVRAVCRSTKCPALASRHVGSRAASGPAAPGGAASHTTRRARVTPTFLSSAAQMRLIVRPSASHSPVQIRCAASAFISAARSRSSALPRPAVRAGSAGAAQLAIAGCGARQA